MVDRSRGQLGHGAGTVQYIVPAPPDWPRGGWVLYIVQYLGGYPGHSRFPPSHATALALAW
jgi:hypothetical protein